MRMGCVCVPAFLQVLLDISRFQVKANRRKTITLAAFSLGLTWHSLAIHRSNKRNQGEICGSKKCRKKTREQSFSYYVQSYYLQRPPSPKLTQMILFFDNFLLNSKKKGHHTAKAMVFFLLAHKVSNEQLLSKQQHTSVWTTQKYSKLHDNLSQEAS